MFYENNTRETWQDAKDLGGLDELEAGRPVAKPVVWALYGVYSDSRREGDELKPIKAAVFEKACKNALSYETDLAVKVLQSADDHYLKLCVEKIKRTKAK